jgi:hypothetical protein
MFSLIISTLTITFILINFFGAAVFSIPIIKETIIGMTKDTIKMRKVEIE